MFSELFYKILRLQMDLSSLMGSVPFEYNKGVLIITNKSLKKYYFNVILLAIGVLYVWTRVINTYLDGNRVQFSFILPFSLCGIFAGCAFGVYVIHPEYSACVLNALIDYGITFTRTWIPTGIPLENKYKEYIICSTFLLQFPCAILISLHYFFFPSFVLYPFSIFPNLLNPLSYWWAGLVFYYMLQYIWINYIFTFIIASSYIVVLAEILSKEFMPNQSGYKTINSLRTPRNLPIAYRNLELVFKNFNLLYEPYIIPLQSLCTQISLVCNFTLITMFEDLDGTTKAILTMWTIGLLSMWTVALEFGGWMHSKGLKVLKSWKYFDWSKRDKKYLSKFRKSCRPLGIRVGGYYCIRRLTVLKFLRGIVRGTFRALLTMYKKK